MVQRPQTTTRDKLPTSTGAGFLSSTVLPGWVVFFWKNNSLRKAILAGPTDLQDRTHRPLQVKIVRGIPKPFCGGFNTNAWPAAKTHDMRRNLIFTHYLPVTKSWQSSCFAKPSHPISTKNNEIVSSHPSWLVNLLPRTNVPLPRNKGFRAGLTKENQWLMSPSFPTHPTSPNGLSSLRSFIGSFGFIDGIDHILSLQGYLSLHSSATSGKEAQENQLPPILDSKSTTIQIWLDRTCVYVYI